MATNQHGWYTADEKAHHVQSYLSSNLSLTQYSNENNLHKSTLATWLRLYNSANLMANNSFQDVTPIIKQEPIISNTNIKLTLPNGIILEFDYSIFSHVIKELK